MWLFCPEIRSSVTFPEYTFSLYVKKILLVNKIVDLSEKNNMENMLLKFSELKIKKAYVNMKYRTCYILLRLNIFVNIIYKIQTIIPTLIYSVTVESMLRRWDDKGLPIYHMFNINFMIIMWLRKKIHNQYCHTLNKSVISVSFFSAILSRLLSAKIEVEDSTWYITFWPV